jgi:large subunit ribosomal protein L20
MPRVKKGTIGAKRRRSVLKAAKGFRNGRSTKERSAKVALTKAGAHAFAHRKDKKNDFRRLWSVRLNAALRENGTTYSAFIGAAKKANVLLNRKMLSEIAAEYPDLFKKIIAQVKK